jgi:hypothetical protein
VRRRYDGVMIQAALLLVALAADPAVAPPASLTAIRVQEKQVKEDPLDVEFGKLMTKAGEANNDYLEKKKTDPKTPRWEVGMWDQFQALADKGSGRALLWLAQSAQHKYEGKKEILAKKLELFGQLIEKFGSADWADQIVPAVQNQKKYFGMAEMDKLLSQLKSTSKNRDAQAASLEALCSVLSGTSAGASEQKRVEEYKASLIKDYQGTRTVDRLNAKEFKDKNLQVGMAVPDIAAKDIEGVAFKLSDYKGKVVLLDFWGFW